MKNDNIILRINSDLKNDFKNIVETYNTTTSNVLVAFIQDVVKRKQIPLSYLPYIKSSKENLKINIPLIKNILEEIIQESCPGKVKKAYLFGSFARGEETSKSDIDIRLDVTEDMNLIDLSYISDQLKEKLKREIDLVPSQNLEERFLLRIKNEEICIYDNQ